MTPRSLTPGFSLSLDLIRFWAALVVLFSHFATQRISGGLFWQFNIIPFGHHAVVFFFVLSGLLMAYVVQGRENTALKYYSARIVRMSTVVVPMLILVPLLDLVGSNFSEKNYEGIFNNPLDAGKQILLGTTYLHKSWWQSTRYFSNTPYWSIAYEVWYYIAFGTLVFLKGIRRWVAFFMTVLVAGPKIFLLFPVWMMGVAVWHITRIQIPKWLAMPLFIVSLTTYILWFTFGFHEQFEATGLELAALVGLTKSQLGFSSFWLADYFLGILFALTMISLAGSKQQGLIGLLSPVESKIRWLANGTFTLYLMHMPIMLLLASILPGKIDNPWRGATILTLSIAACYTLAPFTERRKQFWTKMVRRGTSVLGLSQARN